MGRKRRQKKGVGVSGKWGREGKKERREREADESKRKGSSRAEQAVLEERRQFWKGKAGKARKETGKASQGKAAKSREKR